MNITVALFIIGTKVQPKKTKKTTKTTKKNIKESIIRVEKMSTEEIQKLEGYRKRHQNTKNCITKQVLFVVYSIKDE